MTPKVLPEALIEERERLHKAVYDKLAAEGGGTWATYMMMDIEAAFTASPPSRVLQDEGVVAVKPLEWSRSGAYAEAHTVAGMYRITEYKGMGAPFKLERPGRAPDLFYTFAEADAAAQADYDARIRSAILPSTIGGSVGVSEVEAAADREWDKLCEKDDRSSPVEYPDMALITRDELRDAIAAALPTKDPDNANS